MPAVSVIIPVYNTENYIAQALQSVRRQSLQDIEILVVDDGSTDGSAAVVRSVAATDPRVVLYSRPNGGVSAARNTGMEHARGEYTYFLDSDDLLEPGALESCYRKCKTENLDFVFFDARNLSEAEKNAFQQYTHLPHPGGNIRSGTEWLRFQLDNRTFRTPVWLNFIRTSYWQEHRLRFYPGIIHEDELFTFLLYFHAKRVGYLPRTFTGRRLREGSIMMQKFSRKNTDGYLTVFGEISRLRRHPDPEIRGLTRRYLSVTLNAVVWRAHTLPFPEKLRFLGRCFSGRYLRYIRPRNLGVLFFK